MWSTVPISEHTCLCMFMKKCTIQMQESNKKYLFCRWSKRIRNWSFYWRNSLLKPYGLHQSTIHGFHRIPAKHRWLMKSRGFPCVVKCLFFFLNPAVIYPGGVSNQSLQVLLINWQSFEVMDQKVVWALSRYYKKMFCYPKIVLAHCWQEKKE